MTIREAATNKLQKLENVVIAPIHPNGASLVATTQPVLNRIHLPEGRPSPASRPLTAGPMRHPPRERLDRHRHDEAFIALVLAGAYVEAGDTGRYRLRPGDVLMHRCWEYHLDEVASSGAQVLILPLPTAWEGPTHAVAPDPDAVARLAERDLPAALGLLAGDLRAAVSQPQDWPDLLAARLRQDPDAPVASWARELGLHPGSLARGFRQVFGVTPAAYRLYQRTHRAIGHIVQGNAGLAAVAAQCGFADQAHMSRAIRRMTGQAATQLRRSAQGAMISRRDDVFP
jgi:AraC-like DNA-binding protein